MKEKHKPKAIFKGVTVGARVTPDDRIAVLKKLEAGEFERFGINNESQLIKGLYYRIARGELVIQ